MDPITGLGCLAVYILGRLFGGFRPTYHETPFSEIRKNAIKSPTLKRVKQAKKIN